MRKTLVYLPDEQITELKHMAVDLRTSMAELIRRAVNGWLKAKPQRKRKGARS
jgi:Ribbon-helix-helix protein, copG family